ncbi:MAG: TOBE domain-containing protein [Eggerthellaceae bacterium]|jgi:molybdate transport system regulatory protein
MRIMISARNQFVGTVVNVKAGAVNGVVTIKSGDEEIKADITMESIKQLGLKEGVEAAAVVKATSVMFASGSERFSNLSARNQFIGTISNVKEGAVNGHITLSLPDGNQITGSITNEAIEELGLTEGAPAVAIIKSTDVMVATF